jgi:hypothetical protein
MAKLKNEHLDETKDLGLLKEFGSGREDPRIALINRPRGDTLSHSIPLGFGPSLLA